MPGTWWRHGFLPGLKGSLRHSVNVVSHRFVSYARSGYPRTTANGSDGADGYAAPGVPSHKA